MSNEIEGRGIPEGLRKSLEEAGFAVVDRAQKPDSMAPLKRFTICAMSLAIIALIEELMPTDDKGAEGVLRGCWLFVHDDVMATARCPPHAHQVINEYFTHGGDWKVMRQCMRKHALGTGAGDEAALDALIAEKLVQVRKEYQQASARQGAHP